MSVVDNFDFHTNVIINYSWNEVIPAGLECGCVSGECVVSQMMSTRCIFMLYGNYNVRLRWPQKM